MLLELQLKRTRRHLSHVYVYDYDNNIHEAGNRCHGQQRWNGADTGTVAVFTYYPELKPHRIH